MGPLLRRIDGGVAVVTLNRPEVHNAFDDVLVRELAVTLSEIDADRQVRAVVLAANGKSFSAGADLRWMRRAAGYSESENTADARALAELLRTLDRLSKPTIARVQGAAYGGGVGLVACCDMAIASRDASFCLSEVRLGLIPAVISPYVIAAIGERRARRYFLSAERFDAAEAFRIGLVHDIVEADALDEVVDDLLAHLLAGGPQALAATKELIAAVAGQPRDAALLEDTAQRIGAIRTSPEGREGMSAFLEKRLPAWRVPAAPPPDAGGR